MQQRLDKDYCVRYHPAVMVNLAKFLAAVLRVGGMVVRLFCSQGVQ